MSGTGCIEVEVQYVWACIEFDPGKVVLEANVTGIILLVIAIHPFDKFMFCGGCVCSIME